MLLRTLPVLVAIALAATPGARAEPGGSFRSSDPLLNEIWRDSVRTATDMISPPVRLDRRRCTIRLRLVGLLDRYYPAHTEHGLLVNHLGAHDYAYFARRGKVVAYYNAQYALALELASRLATWTGDARHARAWRARRERLASLFGRAF